MLKECGFVSDVPDGVQQARILAAAGRVRQGLSVTLRDDVAVTHIAARQGMRAAIDERAWATLGVHLPSGPRAVESVSMMIVWAGPDQWLVIQPQTAGTDPSAELAKSFSGLASVVDVSDSRTIFRVSGPSAKDALSKSIPIDFHDRVFKPGDVAITHFAHLGVTLWRLADGQGCDIACARTFSADLLDWLGGAAGDTH
jgi:heterotetrameric sarcosine oxidase gamma subunit